MVIIGLLAQLRPRRATSTRSAKSENQGPPVPSSNAFDKAPGHLPPRPSGHFPTTEQSPQGSGGAPPATSPKWAGPYLFQGAPARPLGGNSYVLPPSRRRKPRTYELLSYGKGTAQRGGERRERRHQRLGLRAAEGADAAACASISTVVQRGAAHRMRWNSTRLPLEEARQQVLRQGLHRTHTATRRPGTGVGCFLCSEKTAAPRFRCRGPSSRQLRDLLNRGAEPHRSPGHACRQAASPRKWNRA